MTTTTLKADTYGPQDINSSETLLSEDAVATTIIQDTGGTYTFGVNINASNVQLGDLSGDGFTIEATSASGVAVQILGSNDIVEGNILSANDSAGSGGGDLVTGSGVNNLTIAGNTFNGIGNWLAYVNGALDTYSASNNVNFINNTFTGTATAGADISDDAASGIISGNSFSGSGNQAIFLGTISTAVASYYNTLDGTTYTSVPGTITVSDNDFSGWSGADVSTFDANYTFANGGSGITLTDTVMANGQEIDEITGWAGGTIALNTGFDTAVSAVQNGNEVTVSLSNGDEIIIQGNNVNLSTIGTALQAAPTITALVGQPVNGGTIEVRGTGTTDGDTITLYEGNSVVGTGTVGDNGAFDITTTVTFAGGPVSLTATETDSANLTSAQSAAFDVNVGITTAEIDEIYQSVLHHSPSAAELTSALTSDLTIGYGGVIAAIVNSAEAFQSVYPVAQIIDLATEHLPTAAQFAAWVPAVEQGLSLSQVANAFVASDAFGKIYNGGSDVNPNAVIASLPNADAIITDLYQQAFNANATPTQVDAWLHSGLSIAQVFTDFALSDQYTARLQPAIQQDLIAAATVGTGIPPANTPPPTPGTLTTPEVNSIFQAVLQHSPTDAEVSSTLAVDLAIGDAGTIATIVNSAEALENVYPVAQIIDLATGNLPAAAQLTAWVPAVEHGLSLAQVANAFVASDAFGKIYNSGHDVDPNAIIDSLPNADTLITTLYQHVFNESPTTTQADAWLHSGLSLEQIFTDFALGDQFTAALQPAIQQDLTEAANNAITIVGSADVSHSLIAHG